jgi:hypothetical protein|tara:strand:+ start:10196 stop:10381 length:186 start_codon:yes stop_codon:yes gene_type:complete
MSNIHRDEQTGAILNTDADALNKYKIQRNYYRQTDKITSDLLDIKASIINIYERIEKLEKN